MSRKSRVYANTINRPPVKKQGKKFIKAKRPIQKNVYVQVDRETQNNTTQTDDLRTEVVYEEIDEELPTNENPSELLPNENRLEYLTSSDDIEVNSKNTSNAKSIKCKECCCIITTIFTFSILIFLILYLYYNWRLQIANAEMNFEKRQIIEEIN
ncbi:uncharacterized protein ACRADG_002326 isoform 1-T1 [Cochliomyia hominivorax]